MTERLEKELALRPVVEKIMDTCSRSPVCLDFVKIPLTDALVFLGPDWSITDSRARIVKRSPDPFARVLSMPIHKALPIIGIHEEFVLFQHAPFMKAARSFLDRVKIGELRSAMDRAWKNARLRISPFPERCVEPAPEPVAMPSNPLTDYGTPDVANDVVSASVQTMTLHEEAPVTIAPNNYPAAGIVVRVYTDVENGTKAVDGWYAMSGSTYKWGMFDAEGYPIKITNKSRWQLIQGCADLNSFYKA